MVGGVAIVNSSDAGNPTGDRIKTQSKGMLGGSLCMKPGGLKSQPSAI